MKKPKITRTRRKPKNSGKKKRSISKQVAARAARATFAERLAESERERKFWMAEAERLKKELAAVSGNYEMVREELNAIKADELEDS